MQHTSENLAPAKPKLGMLPNTGSASDIGGIIVTNESWQIVAALGAGADSRIEAIVTDPQWIEDALAKRIVPIMLTDRKLVAYTTKIGGGHLVLLSEGPTENVLRFFLNVDFAYDIIDHVLTDPYDAMVVIDAKEKLSYISPVHEKFFGLEAEEGIGQDVRSVIENTRLPHVLKTGVAEVGQLHRMKGSDRVVSRHPIRHRGNIVGAIGRIMFKGPQQVEELSRRVNALEQRIAIYKMESSEAQRGERFLDAIIGKSIAIQSVRQQIRKVAPLDVPVLIQGESGTGKELVAAALHMLSPRHGGRMVCVNAAALPAALVESELFGYEAGSFTGADRKGRPGKFELADKGTIFLDEIGDMPLDVQSKVLRVLQDRVVERVGGGRAIRVDFRLCSATNHDLQTLVEQGKFRLDLFYRISPVRIVLPSLEERVEDIPLLLHHFLKLLAEKYARPVPKVDQDILEFLMGRAWPGNIRQLQHEVERAFVFCETDLLSVEDFHQDSASKTVRQSGGGAMSSNGDPGQGAMKSAIEQLERELIADAMTRFKGNKKKVAEHLGISRSYLYKKLEE